jgi:hypothetical protein
VATAVFRFFERNTLKRALRTVAMAVVEVAFIFKQLMGLQACINLLVEGSSGQVVEEMVKGKVKAASVVMIF